MSDMKKWDRQLEDYNVLVKGLLERREKGKGGLRFDRPFILASDVAEQYFCEKKVEMQYLHGEIETEEKTIGTEAHEKLLEDSVKIKKRRLWQKIYGTRPVFALEMLLLAKHKDVIIIGRPDSILFQKGFPLIVFEYKFSRSQIPFMTHHVQARTYGILLHEMGFDTKRLLYAIVMVDPKAKDDKQLKRKVVSAIIKNGPKEATLSIENAKIQLSKFNKIDSEKDLDWAIEYWKNKRDATPTKNMNKCKSCEYFAECKGQTYKQLF